MKCDNITVTLRHEKKSHCLRKNRLNPKIVKKLAHFAMLSLRDYFSSALAEELGKL